MVIATVLLAFSPVIKIGTGHIKDSLLDRSGTGQSRFMVLMSKLLNYLLDE